MADDLYAVFENDIADMEGLRLYCYDDATGDKVIPGYTMKGHPTLGYGLALDTHGISLSEANFLRSNTCIEVIDQCLNQLPFFSGLSFNRKRVIVNMVYQLGIAGVKSFKDMIAHIEIGNWEAAGLCMMDSAWAKTQTPARARKLFDLWNAG